MKKEALIILGILTLTAIASSGCLETNEGYIDSVIGMDHDGNIHVVWLYLPLLGDWGNDAGGRYYKKISSEGETLIDDIKLPSRVTEGGLCIVTDANSSAHIFYGLYYVKINSVGMVEKKRGMEQPYSVAVDQEDNIHFTLDWDGRRYIKLDNEGETILGPASLDEIICMQGVRVVNVSGKYFFLGDWGCVDSNNNVHEVWDINTSNIQESFSYRKMSSNGTVLINTTYRGGSELHEYYYNRGIKIKTDSENNLHVAWEDQGKGYYAKFDNNGTFLFTKNFSYTPSLFLDSEDNVYVLGIKPKDDDKLVLHYTKMDVDGNVLVKKEIVVKTYLTTRFVLTVLSVIAIIVVGIAVVVYLIKRRHRINKRNNTTNTLSIFIILVLGSMGKRYLNLKTNIKSEVITSIK
ncbi:MAG: hypothetical protein QMC80_02015 [Thermoplasmatales archaeon]|nr:hypothetical protein [Thermoplasmatales archaeon]